MELPRPGSRALLRTVHAQLRAAVVDGRLQAGIRLPSTRALAAAYGVSRNTAVAAYDLLLSEGYLSTRRGSGTFVAKNLPLPPRRRATPARVATDRRLSPHWRGCSLPGAGNASPLMRYAFQIGVPDPHDFPFDVWRRLSGRVLRRARTAPLAKPDPQGRLGLRRAIAQHVSFARAVACGPDDILVTAGAQQAFDLLARVLVTPGRTMVALEDPGYPPLRAAFGAAGARIAAVPVDAEGLIVDRVPRPARVVCVTPSHQFPLGTVMSAGRRTAVLELARANGAVVIEDDYDGEYRFVERPLDALQTLDRRESVFYVGTFSKILLPDLRLGYIVAPGWALAALIAAKQIVDGQCNTLAQDSLADLIAEGHLARHVRRMQRLYRQRRETLLAGLRSDFARWLEPVPSVAGLHVAAVLKGPITEATVVARARHLGVGVEGLHGYYAGRAPTPGLLLGYGAIRERSIPEGLALLRRVWVAVV
jgi:GntR family transcriptional regulator / MocR family aminotransferase